MRFGQRSRLDFSAAIEANLKLPIPEASFRFVRAEAGADVVCSSRADRRGRADAAMDGKDSLFDGRIRHRLRCVADCRMPRPMLRWPSGCARAHIDEVIGQTHLLGEGKPLRAAFVSAPACIR